MLQFRHLLQRVERFDMLQLPKLMPMMQLWLLSLLLQWLPVLLLLMHKQFQEQPSPAHLQNSHLQEPQLCRAEAPCEDFCSCLPTTLKMHHH